MSLRDVAAEIAAQVAMLVINRLVGASDKSYCIECTVRKLEEHRALVDSAQAALDEQNRRKR